MAKDSSRAWPDPSVELRSVALRALSGLPALFAAWADGRSPASPAQAQQASQPGYRSPPDRKALRRAAIRAGSPAGTAAVAVAAFAGRRRRRIPSRCSCCAAFRSPAPHAIPQDQLATRLSTLSRQEGLAGRPRCDRRRRQRHLSRRRLSSQPRHRAAAGHRGRPRFASRSSKAASPKSTLKGEGAEQFGIRPMLDAGAGRAAVAACDAGAATAADQRPARRAHRRIPRSRRSAPRAAVSASSSR